MSNQDPSIHFNGINAVTGNYALTCNPTQLMQRVHPSLKREQALYSDAVTNDKLKKKVYRDVRHGINPTKLEETGWGIIFAHADPQIAAIQEALSPLLHLRTQQAGPYYRIFTGHEAYRFYETETRYETKTEFLRRFRVSAGAVDPKNGVPYYLLLIGSPELIPYEFQYELDIQFAVGRLDFETLDEYEHYAKAVVAAETGQQPLAPTASFFSVVNADDSATEKTDRLLTQPLIDALSHTPGWNFTAHQGAAANRAQLEALLGGAQKPALLFTASHGIEFPAGDPRQETHQGALLCSEWPGPREWHGALPESFYFAGDHLASNADPSGMIAFHFACYGGGTPQFNEYGDPAAMQADSRQSPLANRPFVAHLPKKLLGHPKGGALAVVSHVDRAWSYSYQQRETAQTTIFESTLMRLLEGHRLGWALEFFNSRYAELAATLSQEINRMEWGRSQLVPYEFASLWTENHDARNYVVLGDPAVRVAVTGTQALGRIAQPAAIPLATDGRPVTISKADWHQTPATVKSALLTALRQIDQLSVQHDQGPDTTPVMRQPVLRDGGRSTGSQVRSAPTRGGALRDGSANRGGAIRGGTTRSGQPAADDEPEQ